MNHGQSSFSRRQTRNLSHAESSAVFGYYLLTSGFFDNQFFLAFTNCTGEKTPFLTGDNEHLCIITEDMEPPDLNADQRVPRLDDQTRTWRIYTNTHTYMYTHMF